MKNPKLKMQNLLIITFFVVLFLSLTPQSAQAICEGPIVPCGGQGQPACEFCHIFVLIDKIIKFILTCLTPIIAGLMLTLGGFYFLIAGPSPEKVRDAKAIITAAVIGLVIIFVAWIFLNSFLSYIGLANWTGKWWKINCGPTCAEIGGICLWPSECAGLGGNCHALSPLDCIDPCCCILR